MKKKYIKPVVSVKIISGVSLLSGSDKKVTDSGIMLGDGDAGEGDAGEAAGKGVNYIW